MTASPDALRQVSPACLAVLLLVYSTGCAQQPPPYLDPPVASASTPTPASVTGATAEPSPPVALPADAVWADQLTRCGKGQVTTLRWTTAAVAAGPIAIWVDGPTPSLFATAGAAGSKPTGPWTSPGMTLLVKDAKGRLMSTIVIAAGVACD